jgi:glycosyltransferase involved in cell wall biosynthesis
MKERDSGVRVIRLRGAAKPGNVFSYGWIWFRMLFTMLCQPPAQLLVTMSDPPLLVAAGRIVKAVKGCRHINWCHDLYPDILPALDIRIPRFTMSMFKTVSRGAMRNADKVIVIGRCMARHLSYDGIDPRHITMIPNWPDFELVKPPAESGVLLKDKAVNGYKPYDQQLKSGPKFRVLYAGNIGLAHPVDTILGAAKLLNEDHPEIEFVFVGDGPRFDAITRERTRLHLDNIRLMPYQPPSRLRQVMESGDLHLVSVKDSAAGMLVPCKLYSALAVQRPCIFVGPAASEAAKVISDFKAGAVVAQGDAAALAREILRFRTNGDDWFAAHSGATSAGQIFLPKEAINAWIERAWSVVEPDLRDAA